MIVYDDEIMYTCSTGVNQRCLNKTMLLKLGDNCLKGWARFHTLVSTITSRIIHIRPKAP